MMSPAEWFINETYFIQNVHDEGHQPPIRRMIKKQSRSARVILAVWLSENSIPDSKACLDLQGPWDSSPNKPFCLIRACFCPSNASQWFHLFPLQDLDTNVKLIIALSQGLLLKQGTSSLLLVALLISALLSSAFWTRS